GSQLTHETYIGAQIVVPPLPLIPGDLDIQVGFSGVVDLLEGSCRRKRHDHQNDCRNDRPQKLYRSAFVEGRRLVTAGFAVGKHAVEHDPEDQHPDHHTDPDHHHMNGVNVLADIGDP